MLLQETVNSEKFEVLPESEGGAKTFRLRGVFSRANTPNKNKRIYPREILEAAVEECQSYIKEGRLVGELDHPSHLKINMEKISHKVNELKMMEDGAVVGEIVPAGPYKSKLISLLEDDIGVGVSTRGAGALKPYNGPLGEGLFEVQKGFAIKAIDAVHEASAGTYPEKVYEETESGILYANPSNFKEVFDEVFGKRI